HPDRREAPLGRSGDDGLRPPGPLRARRRRGDVPARRRDRRAHRRPAPARFLDDGGTMKATQRLHDAGQSIWLDHITRGLLTSGTLGRYVKELSVTGLTSNPTIFDQAIAKRAAYEASFWV